MKNKLINLDDFNAQQNSLYWQLNPNEPRLNGIACPKCDEELFDSNPMTTFNSMPPKKNVHCSKCDYVGYRTAL